MAKEVDAFEEFEGYEFSDGKPVLRLNDEVTGKEKKFRLVARNVIDGQLYYAIEGFDDDEGQYWVFKIREDGDDICFESIDDDEEHERLVDIFNDMLFEDEIDYDN